MVVRIISYSLLIKDGGNGGGNLYINYLILLLIKERGNGAFQLFYFLLIKERGNAPNIINHPLLTPLHSHSQSHFPPFLPI